MLLKDKIAVVTGSAQGIGEGIAWGLAKEGAKVVIADRDYKLASLTAQKISDQNMKAVAHRTDVSIVSDVRGMIKATLDAFGRIDILVNNAGISVFTPLFDVSEDVWEETINVNLKSVFLCSQAVAKEMIKTGSGSIVNISSTGARLAFRNLPHYCASKGGVESLTRQMALELGQYGIRVNVVAPGVIQTQANKHILSDERVAESWRRNIPLGRIGNPDDIAGPVIFLCSDYAKYITGYAISVDGGWAISPVWPE